MAPESPIDTIHRFTRNPPGLYNYELVIRSSRGICIYAHSFCLKEWSTRDMHKSDKCSARPRDSLVRRKVHISVDYLDIRTAYLKSHHNGAESAITPQLFCDATTKTFNMPPLFFQSSQESASSTSSVP